MSEPVRLRIYPLVALAVGFLAVKGYLDADTANYILGAVVLILGMLGVEAARAVVTPVIKVLDPDTGVPTGEYVAPSPVVINTPEPTVTSPISDEPGDAIDDDDADLPKELD